MVGKGVILRLVDVTLIVLFGFISITDIQQKVRLDLPVSDPHATQNRILELLEIEVLTEPGQFVTERRPADDPAAAGQWIPIQVPVWYYRVQWDDADGPNEATAAHPGELETLLGQLTAQYVRVEQVALLPSDASPVEGTVAVYDICRRLRLPLPVVDLAAEETP
ncbi:MAG: hypothetical protein C4524_00845 [Candidatus Zixiibacteriota bacterium]|nr:MAG: hypothetical protein C4524_00845 [candidate division Zixibacteria bacterium]